MSVAPEKILVRGVNWLGDAVMTTPALLRLRERFPSAAIIVLTPEKLGTLYLDHPAVNRVLMASRGDGLATIGSWLRAEKFDLAVILPNSPRSALEVFLGRVPRRLGYARPLRNWLLTDRVADRPGVAQMRKRPPAECRERIAAGATRDTFDLSAHHIHHYLHLVSALGANPAPLAPLLRVSAAAVARAREKFSLPDATLFALNAGAEYGPAKRWPEERFVAAATELHRRTGCAWLVLGGPGDADLAQRVTDAVAAAIGVQFVRNLAGQTTLRELCAVLRCCDLLLSNDTGPMHVAAALGTPTVVPFGSTAPELTGPGLPVENAPGWVVGQAACAPCFLRECPVDFRCMRNIEVSDVVKVALTIKTRPRQACGEMSAGR